jgi:hypothetical protein
MRCANRVSPTASDWKIRARSGRSVQHRNGDRAGGLWSINSMDAERAFRVGGMAGPKSHSSTILWLISSRTLLIRWRHRVNGMTEDWPGMRPKEITALDESAHSAPEASAPRDRASGCGEALGGKQSNIMAKSGMAAVLATDIARLQKRRRNRKKLGRGRCFAYVNANVS